MLGCFVFLKGMEVRALKNCQPFYARFCKVIRNEPIMGKVLPRKGRRVSIPIDPLNTLSPPPRPTPHPLFPNLKYDRFWPWNLAFPGSLFLVISKKWHRNFKVVKFPQVANSLPVCGERNWIQVSVHYQKSSTSSRGSLAREARVGQSPILIEYGQPLFIWLSRDWPSVHTYIRANRLYV